MGIISSLFRIKQYYKNLLIFLPIIFSGNLFHTDLLLLTIVGFVALCLLSSSNYILNDIIDIKRDRLHPEKRLRPLASRAIPVWQGVLFFVLFLIASLMIAATLPREFVYTVLFLFLFTLLYTIWLKHEVFLDILAIAINFVARAAAGAFIIDVHISPWLVLGVFFLSIFLSVGKRYSDAMFLKKDAVMHRKTLQYYTKELTNAMMIIATVLLVMSYALYSFLSEHENLLFTLPFALYVIFRYFSLIYAGSPIARHPEKVFGDIRMMLGMAAWGIVTLLILYW